MIFESIKELEIMLSDLVFSGINNIDYDFIEDINSLSDKFEKLGMRLVSSLIKDLTNSIKEYKYGIGDIENVSANISRLEFYLNSALYYE